jgi:hypothetical protein
MGSIFSGLNNMEVDIIIRNKFSDKFRVLESDIDETLFYYKKDNIKFCDALHRRIGL